MRDEKKFCLIISFVYLISHGIALITTSDRSKEICDKTTPKGVK